MQESKNPSSNVWEKYDDVLAESAELIKTIAEVQGQQYDKISRPEHYCATPHEPIEVIEAWGLNFNLGNVVKYISRNSRKHPDDLVSDLKKAKWYLNREIENREKEGGI